MTPERFVIILGLSGAFTQLLSLTHGNACFRVIGVGNAHFSSIIAPEKQRNYRIVHRIFEKFKTVARHVSRQQ